jgi:hypothetical protein
MARAGAEVTATTRDGIGAVADAIRDHAAATGIARRSNARRAMRRPPATAELRVARLAERDGFLRHAKH